MLNQKDINKLIKLGEKYGCELYLPPIMKMKHPFFVIDDIRYDTTPLINFLKELKKNKMRHEFVRSNKNKKYYMLVYKEGENNDKNSSRRSKGI